MVVNSLFFLPNSYNNFQFFPINWKSLDFFVSLYIF